jgi:hypothetical protein
VSRNGKDLREERTASPSATNYLYLAPTRHDLAFRWEVARFAIRAQRITKRQLLDRVKLSGSNSAGRVDPLQRQPWAARSGTTAGRGPTIVLSVTPRVSRRPDRPARSGTATDALKAAPANGSELPSRIQPRHGAKGTRYLPTSRERGRGTHHHLPGRGPRDEQRLLAQQAVQFRPRSRRNRPRPPPQDRITCVGLTSYPQRSPSPSGRGAGSAERARLRRANFAKWARRANAARRRRSSSGKRPCGSTARSNESKKAARG